jgi:hypothetical protein
MSSIIRAGDTFHGISVFGRGVFTEKRGTTYAGQCRGGYACGLGVLTTSSGFKAYAEHGPDGQCDGRNLGRNAHGDTYHCLCERGEEKAYARVSADGSCMYNFVDCAPDDPRLLALTVEVRPAAPHRHSPATRPQAIVRWIGRLVLLPQALAAAIATEVHPHAARRRWWLCDTTQQQPHCKARPRSDAYTGLFAVLVSREACTLMHPLTTAAWGTTRARPGSVVAMPSSGCKARPHSDACTAVLRYWSHGRRVPSCTH